MISIFSYVLNMNGLTQFTACAVPIISIMLFILHKRFEKKQKGLMVWRLLCFLPLVICVLHLYFNAFRGNVGLTMKYYLPFTVAAVLAVFLPLFAGNDISLEKQKGKKHYRVYAVFVIIVSVVGFLYGVINIAAIDTISRIDNHTAESYTESFHGLVQDFKENYVLSEWKGIDYDEIEALLMPKIQEAQDTQDEALYCMALYEFIYRIHDDHVWIGTGSSVAQDARIEAEDRLAGDDYGFAMFTTSDGETIAILVDEESEAFKQGIRNGTVITKWNGENVENAASKVECISSFSNFPVAKNEKWVQPIFLAGRGGEQVEVAFLEDNGQEKTVQLQSMGCYQYRLAEALMRFGNEPTLQKMLGDELEDYWIAIEQKDNEKLRYFTDVMNAYHTKNFETKMLTETVGYLQIDSEEYNRFKDVVSIARGSYPEIADMTSDKLDDLKRQGMTSLVIDARNNSGGFETISNAVTSLFTKERFGVSEYVSSKRDGGRLKESFYVDADGRWADLPVVVLTNYQCASSGDELVYALGKCDNVTVMGITESNGICQSIGGMSYLTDSDFYIRYPMFLNLDENGDPLIDTAADRIGRVPVDEFIPVDKEAALQIFGETQRDYELDYAVKYLEGK